MKGMRRLRRSRLIPEPLARHSEAKFLAGRMHFDVVGEIKNIEAIARGPSVRERVRLTAQFGRGRWRKLKGTATVRLGDGWIGEVELHWYEAHGIGRRKVKIKRFLE